MRGLLLLAFIPVATTTATSSTEIESSFQCKYDGNQQEMNACALRDYKRADVTLNQKYKATLAKLPREAQRHLRQQQRAWLKGRDPLCKSEAQLYDGGSMWPSIYFSCLKAETQSRTKAIERWFTT